MALWLMTLAFSPLASAQGASGFASPESYVATNTAVAVATAPTVPLPASMDALDDKHRLAVGDRVSFRIIQDEDEPRSMVITDSGDLDVPHIGRFPARGKTCRELATELKAELEKEYYYTATVILAVDLMARSRGRVWLVGPVRMPGPQDIPSDEVYTVSKAILRAGGFTDAADKRKVRITRKGAEGAADTTTVVDVGEIIEKGRTQNDVVLEAGDLIYVPDRLIRF
jgi:protein involved in polysaccharide export with SLBB domain